MILQKLSAQEILNALPEQCFNVIVEDCLPSTNDYLLNLASTSPTILPKTAVLAETQTNGKGRQGRNWVSPAGNLYLSLYWPFKCSLEDLYGLSLVVGIAIARVLKNNGLHDVQLKWPNDIYWQNHKMGGILIETKSNKFGVIDTIIGIGLNIVDMSSQSHNIDQKFVSLENALERTISLNLLVPQLLIELNDILTQFTQLGFDAFVAEWQSLDAKIASKSGDNLDGIEQITSPKNN